MEQSYTPMSLNCGDYFHQQQCFLPMQILDSASYRLIPLTIQNYQHNIKSLGYHQHRLLHLECYRGFLIITNITFSSNTAPDDLVTVTELGVIHVAEIYFHYNQGSFHAVAIVTLALDLQPLHQICELRGATSQGRRQLTNKSKKEEQSQLNTILSHFYRNNMLVS